MMGRASLLSSLCLLGTTSSSETFEQRGGSIGSSWKGTSPGKQMQHSCNGVSVKHQSGALADEGSLLLQSQVRKPQDAGNAVSEEMLRELVGIQHQPVQLSSESHEVALLNFSRILNESDSTSASMLSLKRISSGVTPSGELAQMGSTMQPQRQLSSLVDADLKDGNLVQIQHFQPPKEETLPWFHGKQILELVQTACLQRSESLAEGVMLFVLCNIFLCAIVSGICFIWNGRSHDADDGDWAPGEKSRGKKETMNGRGIGALEERRSHALVQKQAPSARASMTGSNNGHRHSSMGAQKGPPPMDSPKGPARQLCPELVVPLGSECILAVRCLVTAQTQQCEFEVLDINGKAVLKVEVSPQSMLSRKSHGPPLRSPTITLKALQPRETTGGMVLAYCCNVSKSDNSWNSSSGKRNVCIYNESDELFAHVVKDEARHRYVLTSGRPGLQLLFEGNFEERAVDVANEARELLAATEPAAMPFDPINKYYKLRVAADVDVGLVLCGLLAIDQIEIK